MGFAAWKANTEKRLTCTLCVSLSLFVVSVSCQTSFCLGKILRKLQRAISLLIVTGLIYNSTRPFFSRYTLRLSLWKALHRVLQHEAVQVVMILLDGNILFPVTKYQRNWSQRSGRPIIFISEKQGCHDKEPVTRLNLYWRWKGWQKADNKNKSGPWDSSDQSRWQHLLCRGRWWRIQPQMSARREAEIYYRKPCALTHFNQWTLSWADKVAGQLYRSL